MITTTEPSHERDVEELSVSIDAFYRGKFKASQPLSKGHRSGSDALLIAACLPQNASGELADLGAGAGVAGLAAAVSNPGLKVTLVEKNPAMARIARSNVQLFTDRKDASRLQVLEADITLSGSKRVEAGLLENHFDYVIMNPPYNHENQKASPDQMRSEAHVMELFGLDCWMRTAVAMLKPGGKLSMIYRAQNLPYVLACAQGRFGGVSIIPVHSKPDQPAKRVLLGMTKATKAPLSIMPAITLHDHKGAPTSLGERLMNGEERISF